MRSAIYAHDGGRARALRDRPRPARPERRGRDARQPRGDHARAPARRGPRAPAGAALRADRRGPRAGRARRRARASRRAGEPHLRADRDLLAGDDHAAGRARAAGGPRPRPPGRRCSAPGCGSPPTARSSCAARPSRRSAPAARRLAATGRPRRARPARVPARDRAQGRHDRQRRRERRSGRGRGGARGAPGRARGGRRSGAPTPLGRGGHGDRRRRGRARRRRWPSCASTARRALAPYKVPKDFGSSAGPLPRTPSGKLLRRELAMSFDPEAHREASLQGWEAAAPGWVRRQEVMRALAARRSRTGWSTAIVSAAGRARARAGRRARRDRAAAPPSWWRRSAG